MPYCHGSAHLLFLHSVPDAGVLAYVAIGNAGSDALALVMVASHSRPYPVSQPQRVTLRAVF